MTTAPPLRIGIATLGRFHVLDLARELDALGHDVRLYSYVPKRRAIRFGLPARCHVALLPYLFPLIAVQRLCRGTRLAIWLDWLMYHAADWLVAWRLQPCDVFIGMSGIYVRAFATARAKFGARIIVERGSVHIDAQKQILDRIRRLNPRANTVPAYAVRREHRDYLLADRIAIPSRHAEASFIAHAVAPEKLFRNRYGVDLAMFTSNPAVDRDCHLILFVGGWTFQKGVDVLVAAMPTLAANGFRLRHVGGVGDAPLPQADWFESLGSVDQRELPAWYRRARCLVLPSRQDGFGMVLSQALACGCPVIGSTMSGAADLKAMLPEGNIVQTVPIEDPAALAAAIKRCPERTIADTEQHAALREQLSWKAYAQRCEALLLELVTRCSTQTVHATSAAPAGNRAQPRHGDA